jgi:hypothetical protein
MNVHVNSAKESSTRELKQSIQFRGKVRRFGHLPLLSHSYEVEPVGNSLSMTLEGT